MHKIDLRKIDLNLLVVFEVLMQETSVSRAALRLKRSQSAVSHSLARLRDQIGDPLLIKSNGRMQPSPRACDLVEEIRPILKSLERVLGQRELFDLASTSRHFVVAMPDFVPQLYAHLLNTIQREAPATTLEWRWPKDSTMIELAEGQIDAAIIPQNIKLHDDLVSTSVGALHWLCAMRKSHPAAQQWSRKQWACWPHLKVNVGDRVQAPVSEAAHLQRIKRKFGMIVPSFGAVAPVLAKTDLIATLPAIVIAHSLKPYDLIVRPVPFSIKPMPHIMVWSRRLANEPGGVWLRERLFREFSMLNSNTP